MAPLVGFTPVIPGKAGIQAFVAVYIKEEDLDSGFRRSGGKA